MVHEVEAKKCDAGARHRAQGVGKEMDAGCRIQDSGGGKRASVDRIDWIDWIYLFSLSSQKKLRELNLPSAKGK